MNNITNKEMYSLSKKKSKLSPAPADKTYQGKPFHSRNKSKTENSPNAQRSLSKDQIKSTIKKIVSQNQAASRLRTNQSIKE